MATLYSAHTIKNTLTLLSAYAKSINHKTEMIKAKNRFINDMNLIITMTDELLLTTRTTCNLPVSHREMTLMQNQLKDMMHRIRNLQEEQQEEHLYPTRLPQRTTLEQELHYLRRASQGRRIEICDGC